MSKFRCVVEFDLSKGDTLDSAVAYVEKALRNYNDGDKPPAERVVFNGKMAEMLSVEVVIAAAEQQGPFPSVTPALANALFGDGASVSAEQKPESPVLFPAEISEVADVVKKAVVGILSRLDRVEDASERTANALVLSTYVQDQQRGQPFLHLCEKCNNLFKRSRPETGEIGPCPHCATSSRTVFEGVLHFDPDQEEGPRVILAALPRVGDDPEDPDVLVVLESFDEDMKHPDTRPLEGRRARMTLEMLE